METELAAGTLQDIVLNSLSATEVISKLGYSKKGQYIKLTREFLIANGISTDNWTRNGKPKPAATTKECPVCSECFSYNTSSRVKPQVTCSTGCANTYFKSRESNPNWIDGRGIYRVRALEEFGPICQMCGYKENILALEVHHMDHDRDNNDLENLIVLCCNCHAIHHHE